MQKRAICILRKSSSAAAQARATWRSWRSAIIFTGGGRQRSPISSAAGLATHLKGDGNEQTFLPRLAGRFHRLVHRQLHRARRSAACRLLAALQSLPQGGGGAKLLPA